MSTLPVECVNRPEECCDKLLAENAQLKQQIADLKVGIETLSHANSEQVLKIVTLKNRNDELSTETAELKQTVTTLNVDVQILRQIDGKQTLEIMVDPGTASDQMIQYLARSADFFIERSKTICPEYWSINFVLSARLKPYFLDQIVKYEVIPFLMCPFDKVVNELALLFNTCKYHCEIWRSDDIDQVRIHKRNGKHYKSKMHPDELFVKYVTDKPGNGRFVREW